LVLLQEKFIAFLIRTWVLVTKLKLFIFNVEQVFNLLIHQKSQKNLTYYY
jgi:hypothetical protein